MHPTLKIIAIILALAAIVYSVIVSSTTNASEGPIAWFTFDEGIRLAAEQDKKILVDIYTDWCGWCKKMDKEVFPNADVAALLAAKYIAVKLNAESSRKLTYDNKTFTEQEFARALGVTGYPTTLFMTADAEPITIVPGFMDAERFTSVLAFIGDDHYRSMSYEDFLRSIGRTR
jgi:thioredoxin-related protein